VPDAHAASDEQEPPKLRFATQRKPIAVVCVQNCVLASQPVVTSMAGHWEQKPATQ